MTYIPQGPGPYQQHGPGKCVPAPGTTGQRPYTAEEEELRQNCIEHKNRPDANGYVKVLVDGRQTKAHRYAYEQAHGPLAKGLVIDHLCRRRNCVNVEHLEAVTRGENSRRGLRSDPTKCRKGLHEWVEGQSKCVECARINSAEYGAKYYAKNKERLRIRNAEWHANPQNKEKTRIRNAKNKANKAA